MKFSIFNFQFSMKQGGFTLIELLVTMGLLAVIGTILVSVIVSTLRVSTKATVVSDVKQNGDSALEQISKTLRSATSISTPTCSSTPQSAHSITVTQIDNSQITYDCSGSTITSQVNSNLPASMLDTSTVTLVPLTCSITCTQQSAADYPIVQIQFSLQQQNTAANNEQSASVPFETSVTLRNLQQ